MGSTCMYMTHRGDARDDKQQRPVRQRRKKGPWKPFSYTRLSGWTCCLCLELTAGWTLPRTVVGAALGARHPRPLHSSKEIQGRVVRGRSGRR